MFRITVLTVLVALAVTASGDVYTWVDEHGRKHFGDRIPEQYQDQSGTVDVDVRQPTAEEIAAERQRTADMESVEIDLPKRVRQSQGSNEVTPWQKQQMETAGMSDCEKAWYNYRKADECFARCASRSSDVGKSAIHTSRGTEYITTGTTGRSTANCGHCPNYRRPRNC